MCAFKDKPPRFAPVRAPPVKSTHAAPRKLPVGIVSPTLFRAIRIFIQSTKGTSVNWSLAGDISLAWQGLEIKPTDIEILTDNDGLTKIREAVIKYHPSEPKIVEVRLPRDAIVDAANYPLYRRSNAFAFEIEGAALSIHAAMQYKVAEWEWGDVLDFKPEVLNIVGEDIKVVPLVFQLELFRSLGWKDMVAQSIEAIEKAHEGFRG